LETRSAHAGWASGCSSRFRCPAGRASPAVSGAAASIALYAVAFARTLGSARVHYDDSDEQRCAAAAALGADAEHRRGPWPRRYDRAPITVKRAANLKD
jgi:NADPH:quinone reductase-like Zn-dependent oxidoreductase